MALTQSVAVLVIPGQALFAFGGQQLYFLHARLVQGRSEVVQEASLVGAEGMWGEDLPKM